MAAPSPAGQQWSDLVGKTNMEDVVDTICGERPDVTQVCEVLPGQALSSGECTQVGDPEAPTVRVIITYINVDGGGKQVTNPAPYIG